jgi:nicotinate-nucleotide adenylyltransferase
MGGSFNPIHLTHVAMARSAMEEAGLEKVLFLPTGNPPHKREGLIKAGQRMDMVRLALAEEKEFYPSDIELSRNGTIYTVDTLKLLCEQMPGAEFYYIIGEDTLYELKNWREPDRVFKMCRFLVCPRPASLPAAQAQAIKAELKSRGARFGFLSMKAQDLSSTAVRLSLETRGEAEGLHPAVMEYIRVMGLYGVKASPPGAAAHMEKLMASMDITRMAHTMCVAWEARRLATVHGEDAQKAALAGLFHDCAKGMELARMQKLAKANKLTDDPSIMASGSLLHALVGAYLAREAYGIDDEQVLSAIAWHTLGRPDMSRLEMIVYLADKIEPSRETYPELTKIRLLANADLKGAVALSLTSTADYVRGRGKSLHPATEKTLLWARGTQK